MNEPQLTEALEPAGTEDQGGAADPADAEITDLISERISAATLEQWRKLAALTARRWQVVDLREELATLAAFATAWLTYHRDDYFDSVLEVVLDIGLNGWRNLALLAGEEGNDELMALATDFHALRILLDDEILLESESDAASNDNQ